MNAENAVADAADTAQAARHRKMELAWALGPLYAHLSALEAYAGGITDDTIEKALDVLGDEVFATDTMSMLLKMAQELSYDVHERFTDAILRRQAASVDEATLTLDQLRQSIPTGTSSMPALADEKARVARLHNALVQFWSQSARVLIDTPELKQLYDRRTLDLLVTTSTMLRISGAQLVGALQLIDELLPEHPNAELVERARLAVADAIVPILAFPSSSLVEQVRSVDLK